MIHLKQYYRIGLSVIPLIFSSIIQAHEPDAYYDSAQGLSGEELKAALHNIIKEHTGFPYTSSSTDVWDILKETDQDTLNAENVILFYSGWSVNAAQEYNEGKGWTREQVWALSHGDFGTGKGAGTDVHHIRPVDHSVNSARSNKDFDWGGTVYVDGDGPTQCYSDTHSWEPRDAVKGDVARMLFYMAVRYEGENGEPDLELLDEVNTSAFSEPGNGFHGKLSTLLEWHKSDPVDSFEFRRNEVIFLYQGNRNPFIDHPEFVDKIWSITAVDRFRDNPFHIYPIPAKDFIYIESKSGKPVEVRLITLDGKILRSDKTTGKMSIPVRGIPQGIYFISVMEQKKTYIEKVVIGE